MRLYVDAWCEQICLWYRIRFVYYVQQTYLRHTFLFASRSVAVLYVYAIACDFVSFTISFRHSTLVYNEIRCALTHTRVCHRIRTQTPSQRHRFKKWATRRIEMNAKSICMTTLLHVRNQKLYSTCTYHNDHTRPFLFVAIESVFLKKKIKKSFLFWIWKFVTFHFKFGAYSFKFLFEILNWNQFNQQQYNRRKKEILFFLYKKRRSEV